MISIVETVRIPHTPERIWRFFTEEVGRLIDLGIAAVVPVRDLHRHMREEQANLTPLLASVDEERGDEKSDGSDK